MFDIRKRMPHIWLIITYLHCLVFKEHPITFRRLHHRLSQWIFSLTCLFCYVNMFFLDFFTRLAGNLFIIPHLLILCQVLFLTLFLGENKKHSYDMSALTSNYLSSQVVSNQVLSAYKGLTTVFGMGTGGTP